MVIHSIIAHLDCVLEQSVGHGHSRNITHARLGKVSLIIEASRPSVSSLRLDSADE